MYFALDARQQELQQAVRRFAEVHSSEVAVRSAMPDGVSAPGWAELDDVIRTVAPFDGGAVPDLVDCATVLEVLADALYPGPYLSSVLAARLLGHTRRDDAARRLLSTSTNLTVVARPREGDRVDAVDTADDTIELSGELAVVLDGVAAGTVLVGLGVRGWYEVAADSPGLHRRALPALDQTRRIAAITLAATPARRVALDIDDGAADQLISLIEQALVAVDDAGVARHCLRASLDYARTREQFGRPIGSFQAVQHALADAAHAVESAWAAAFEAVWTIEHAPANGPRSVALAAAVAGDAALQAAELMMQVHGGVGFTWDNPSHLYLKRAKSNRLLWGESDLARARLGQLLEL